MILAAAECGRNPKAPPPYELRLAWQAIGYHALPEPGGILDQPAGLLDRMTHACNAWQAYRSYSQRDPYKTEEWIKANPSLHALKLRIDKLREARHA